MTNQKILASALIGTAIWILIGAPAWSAAFVFSTVADTESSTYDSLLAPAINDNGTVAFIAGFDKGGSGVFAVSSNTSVTIADSNGTLIKNFFTSTPSINNSGAVAFVASLHADQYHDDYGIFVGTGAALTEVADSTTGDLTFLMPPSINNAGNVAFAAITNGAGNGVYLASDGGLTELVSPNHPLIGGLIGLTAINDAGTVAFVGQTNDSLKLFTVSMGSPEVQSLVDLPPATLSHGSSLGAAVSINNDGKVLYIHGTGAFSADDSGQVSTIVQGSDSPFQSLHPLPIVDENGVFILNQSSLPSINDHGLAAFFAVDQTGNEGIYVTSEPGEFERVVQTGDALAGSTVVRLVLSSEGINNLGELAFFAELADGRGIIVTATSVPEPSTSYLLLLFGAMAVRHRSRRVLAAGL